MREPVEKQINVNGVMVTLFEWGTRVDKTVLLVHATGFHARCWDQVVNGLGDDIHVISVDMRGHGRSEKTAPYSWKTFGDDLAELVDVLDLTGITGVGHSMGGHSVTQAAAQHPGRFDRLVLVDPVIMAPEFYDVPEQMSKAFPGEHPVSRRRNVFVDADAMYANLEGRGSYSKWRPEVLRDYCNFGLLQAESEPGYVLACPPHVEAAIYMGNADCDIYEMVSRVEIPVKVLRAKARTGVREDMMDFSLSPTWPGLADRFAQGEDVYLPDLTHFIPMQEPALVVEHILQP